MKWLESNVFTNPNVIKVAHNLSFESMFLYARNILISPPYYDTMAAAQMTLKNDTEFRSLSDSGLKTLVPEIYDVGMPKFEEITDGKYFDELDSADKKTILYACADSDFTLRLYHEFNNWFDKFMPKHREIVEQIESPTAVCIGLMKHNGVLIDKELMLEKQKEAKIKIQELKDKIKFITGDINIGVNASTKALKGYLYAKLKLPVLKSTPKYQDSMDDEALILLSDWCKENRPELVELFELIQRYRKWGKIKSTYLDGYLKYINNVSESIHTDLFPLITETGRFASRNPNLQNCPRQNNDPVGVREFLIAPKGHVLLSLDFSQIELRVGAFYCRDEKMLDVYKNNGDIHAQTTSVIYNISLDEAEDKNHPNYKERRVISKNTNFCTFYGLFPNGLRKTLKFKAGLNTSYNECEKIIRNLKEGYPRLSKWQEETISKARLNGYVETYLGRRRYLPQINSDDWGKQKFSERCALNTPIQGTAADILKLSLARILAGLPQRNWLKPILQVHDELIFELPKDKINEAVEFIKFCMEQTPFDGFDVPLVAEASVGYNFGDLKEVAFDE